MVRLEVLNLAHNGFELDFATSLWASGFSDNLVVRVVVSYMTARGRACSAV